MCCGRGCVCRHPALSPWLACPVGAACRGGGGGPSPGGLALHRCEGRLVSGAVPAPPARPLGRAAGVPRPVCQVSACALAGRRCALWGRRKGVPGGGALRHCEGHLRSGASPPPTARPLGGLSGSATHVLWARMCGCGDQHCPLGLHALSGVACRGGGGGPFPAGVACHRCEGRLVSGAVPARPPVL